MNTQDIKKIRSIAKEFVPSLRIGKNGLNEGMINEIKSQLKKKDIIKVKLLKSYVKSTKQKEIAKEISTKSNSILVESVGNIVVLKKKNYKKS
ncbi:YhbY family RNA-binding protein [Nanoarchaeota archaeon]